MSVRMPIESLAAIDDGGDVLNYLLETDGLNYNSFVDVPGGIQRNQGQHDWYEAHLVNADGNGVIRYIELKAGGDSPAFSDLKRHLKRHGSPINELFTVVAYRESDEGPLTSPLTDDLTFLYLDQQFSSEDVEVTFDLKYFTVKRFGVQPAYIDFIEDLAVGSGQGRTSLEGDIEDVFSIREITQSFYEDFDDLFHETLQDAIHGLDDPKENLNAYTRTVVNRVLFLLFIEEKGWLDDDVDYVENKYETAKSDGEKHVYDDFFEPLFFEALSNIERTEYEFLGSIPFLNGGLFERRDIEENVEIDEMFFDALLDPKENDAGEPKGFLRRYKISLRESNESDQELVVDPEFIGRIFEMFMQEGKKEELGTFYTPKPITAYMTRNALKQHLLQSTDVSREEAVALVADHTAPDSLTDEQISAIDEALRSTSILDPAVGSGAFIIAMLEELVSISEALNQKQTEERTRFSLKEEFIADNLYGVDIDPGGVELCKFRVWLHLMQDLKDISHDEFIDRNEEFALPNLGFKFFVGNSLVGEHDPTRIDVGSYQETLTGGLDETLTEIHDTRKAYQPAHGDEKERLGEKLNDLTTELETQLAVKEQGGWMTEVAEEAETTFAWTSKIPEVILSGGFDIVIGNPPYEGQSQQDYIGDLARFYDEKYDFYKTIPRMRHDLYQLFNIRGWELTREGGVLSYITSNTFYTIGSKQTTRQLLQRNQLLDLLRANPNTFDANVEPAIFVLKKQKPAASHKINYIDASDTDIQEYRSFVRELEPTNLDAERVKPLDLPSSSRGYRVQLEIYNDTLRSAFFEPTQMNLRLHDQFMSRIKGLAEKWEPELQDVTTLKNNTEKISEKHTTKLEVGDVSILGLLTLGGQGLSTDKNSKYMSFLEGTEEAEELAGRNPDFELNEHNENEYKYLDMVITEDKVADPSNLTSEEKLNGIDSSKGATWVPIEKGFRQSDLYYKSKVEYINWSRDSLEKIQSYRNGILKNIDYYFEPGVFLSIGGFANLKARYTNNRAVDHTGNIFTSTLPEKLSEKYLTGILNSEIPIHITESFINSTGMETADLRLIPIPIPTEKQRESVESLVDRAIEVQQGKSSESLESIQVEVEEIVKDLYQVNLDE